jgi:hypothetical protein
MAEDGTSSRLIHYLEGFVSVATRRQTYRNLLYLVLLLPLGTLYLIVITFGLGLAVSLIPIGIGVPLLLVALVITTRLITFDRRLTKRLLNVDLPADDASGRVVLSTVVDRLRAEFWVTFTDRSLWNNHLVSKRELIYLLSKHVFGFVAWLVPIFSLLTGLMFLFSPIHHQYPIIGIHTSEKIRFIPEFVYQHGTWQVDVVLPVVVEIAQGEFFSNYVGSAGALLLAVAIGAVLTLLSLHIVNRTAQLYGKFAESMLRSRDESNSTDGIVRSESS